MDSKGYIKFWILDKKTTGVCTIDFASDFAWIYFPAYLIGVSEVKEGSFCSIEHKFVGEDGSFNVFLNLKNVFYTEEEAKKECEARNEKHNTK